MESTPFSVIVLPSGVSQVSRVCAFTAHTFCRVHTRDVSLLPRGEIEAPKPRAHLLHGDALFRVRFGASPATKVGRCSVCVHRADERVVTKEAARAKREADEIIVDAGGAPAQRARRKFRQSENRKGYGNRV